MRRPSRKLKSAYRSRLIDAAASLMLRVEPTPFALEAAIRHWLRRRLCLRGWAWRDADLAAEDVVDRALHRVGAERPTWKAGQPEFTQEGVIMVERFYCINCNSLLPEGHWKFCGTICCTNHNGRIYRMFKDKEARAVAELEDAA
ncbi:hypothetical protein V5F77_10980 [Xanthobacter sp. DSM 24535]|uniref:hypothetical protein n=1 Tax=Roseixanthobacter psychrophilus TaxID=3119917 RepID=UPI0037269542